LPADLGGEAPCGGIDGPQLARDELVLDGLFDLAEVVTAVPRPDLERDRAIPQPFRQRREQVRTRDKTLRADEALPMFAVSVGASLVRTDERISPADGVGAVLRYAPTLH
jgi:hypothetical protein